MKKERGVGKEEEREANGLTTSIKNHVRRESYKHTTHTHACIIVRIHIGIYTYVLHIYIYI